MILSPEIISMKSSVSASLCCSGVGVSSWLFTNRVPTLKEGISHRIRKDSHNHVRIGDAVIQQCDKIATNGIMHVIDTVSEIILFKFFV